VSGQKVSYVQITDQEYRKFMNTAREVENIDQRLQYQLDRQESHLRSDFNNQLNQTKEKIKYNESRINRLDNKVDNLISTIEQRESNKKAQANMWLDEAKDALKAIDSFRHEKFCPNEYAKLKYKLSISQMNYDNEVYESSISSSQILWQEASDLKHKLQHLEDEWNHCFEEATQSNIKLIALCDAQEIVKLAFDTDNGDKELEIDIDHWSKGELTYLKGIVNQEKELLGCIENITTDDLKVVLKNSIKLEEDIKVLTEKAKEAIILSQHRSDMANDIVESLDQSGFELVESCFKNDDERESVHLKLQNRSGDEVVTIITPMENRENKLDIHFFDDSDEQFKQTRLQSMLSRLQDNGVECSQPQCAPGTQFNNTGDEKVRDFYKLQNSSEG